MLLRFVARFQKSIYSLEELIGGWGIGKEYKRSACFKLFQ